MRAPFFRILVSAARLDVRTAWRRAKELERFLDRRQDGDFELAVRAAAGGKHEGVLAAGTVHALRERKP
jgi:hypothetical protein